jgi:hypothetical protein
MKEKSAKSCINADAHGFPIRTRWTEVHNLRDQHTHVIQTYCGKFYLDPLLQYGRAISPTLCPGCDAKDVEDWVMEFLESRLVEIIRSKSTRRPEDGKPLFRHLIRRRFRQFVLDKLKAADAQKRGGHLLRVELVRENYDADESELEPSDARGKTADVQFDFACLRQHYLRAKEFARQEFVKRRRSAEFDILIEAIEDGAEFSASATAKKLAGKSEGAIRTAKSRLEAELGEYLVKSVCEAEQIGVQEAKVVLRDLFEVSRLNNDSIPTVLAAI